MSFVTKHLENHIAYITLDRPEALHALHSEMLQELLLIVEELKKEKDLRVVVIRSTGDRSFVAGADIAEMAHFNATEAKAYANLGHTVFSGLSQLACPVIAQINGYALGGGFELALAADIRIAGEKASFAMPETGLGITPGFGGTQRLSKLVGTGLAAELIFTGRRIKAEEAKALGIVNTLVPQEKLAETVKELAETIARRAPIAIRKAKSLIYAAESLPLAEGLAFEAATFANCFATEDQKNAMKAFLEKETYTDFQNK